jgi:arsenite methyltransferase
MNTTLKVNERELKSAIKKEYTEVAVNPEKGFHFTSGRPLTKLLQYSLALLEGIPETAIESFAGVGNPFKAGLPLPGMTVLDIGCGAGMDALIASKFVGHTGRVFGIDMTHAMIVKARANAMDFLALNTQFIQAQAESIPLKQDSIDLIISNGVINLCPDKHLVFSEMYRIIKPGGHIQLADVLLKYPVSEMAKERTHLWTTCVAGGMLMDEYSAIIQSAGFSNIKITESYDVFKDAPVASSAASFEAKGYNIIAQKL